MNAPKSFIIEQTHDDGKTVKVEITKKTIEGKTVITPKATQTGYNDTKEAIRDLVDVTIKLFEIFTEGEEFKNE